MRGEFCQFLEEKGGIFLQVLAILLPVMQFLQELRGRGREEGGRREGREGEEKGGEREGRGGERRGEGREKGGGIVLLTQQNRGISPLVLLTSVSDATLKSSNLSPKLCWIRGMPSRRLGFVSRAMASNWSM